MVDLVKLRLAVEQWGLKLSAIENVPPHFYDQIMLGGPRRDQQIENMIYTVRNIARAGIPIFGYNWMPSHVWRTPPEHIRGGAVATAFDDALAQRLPLTHGRVYSEEEMWAYLEYWIRIITPIAEEEGIRLGIHPCDPPVPVLGGIPQLLRNFGSYKRLVEIYPSDSNGIEFCQGTMAEMDDDVVGVPVDASLAALREGRAMFLATLVQLAVVVAAGVPLIARFGLNGVGYTMVIAYGAAAVRLRVARCP